MGILWNGEERRLRAGWRLVLQSALMLLLGALPIFLIAEPLTELHRRGWFLAGYNHEAYDCVINIIIGPFLALAAMVSVVIAARFLDRRPLRDFGLQLDRSWWLGLAGGFAVGAALMMGVFVLELRAGWITIAGTMTITVAGVPFALAIAFSTVKALCVGTYEELVSRGYLLCNLAEGMNLTLAIVASSAIFAVLHLFNDNASWLSTFGLFVNGLLFVAARLATGRLSAAIGLHIAWNFFEGVVFGFPVSGDKERASFVAIEQGGVDLVTGGAFGPEAGIVGVAASIAGIAFFALAAIVAGRDASQDRTSWSGGACSGKHGGVV